MFVDIMPRHPTVLTDEQTTLLHLTAAGCERIVSERRQAHRRVVEPTEHEVTTTLEIMQAGCDPAVAALQLIDATLDKTAGVPSKRELTGRISLRSSNGSMANVFDHAR